MIPEKIQEKHLSVKSLKVLNMKPDTHCVSLLLKTSEKTKE